MIARASLIIFLVAAHPAWAQTGANVAVVINDASEASVQIGEYYAQKRQLPAENVIHIKTAPEETIARPVYAKDIEGPLAKALGAEALQDRILYIVLTKGVPLRISGTAGPNGTAASVDSELTLLYRRMTGRPVPPGGTIVNPYYLGAAAVSDARPFSHKSHDIYLVTRIDAFTGDEALALIDRALAPSRGGAIVLDQRADAASAVGDRWIVEAARAVADTDSNRALLVEPTAAAAASQDETLAYYSWGSTDPALRRRRLGIRFGSGSIASMLTSTDARTFIPPPDGWVPTETAANREALYSGSAQSLIGDLIHDGATGVAGNVAEPYFQSAIRPQVLFPAYMRGFNLAESFYLAMPHLSWQAVIIGDPLCRPFEGTRPITPGELDSPVDPQTGIPRLFLDRRLQSLKEDSPGAPAAALLQIAAANARLAESNRPQAKSALSRAIALWPENAALQLRLATMQEEDGESDQAVAGYRRILTMQPRTILALNNLAYSLATRYQDLEEALVLARTAISLAPNDPNVLDTAGWVEHLSGNSLEAVRYLRAAAEKAPDRPEIRLHAAVVLAKAGATTDASEHLDAALKLDSGMSAREDVRELLQLLRRK